MLHFRLRVAVALTQVMVEALLDGLIELRAFDEGTDVVMHPCFLQLFLLLVCHLLSSLVVFAAHVDLPGDALSLVGALD